MLFAEILAVLSFISSILAMVPLSFNFGILDVTVQSISLKQTYFEESNLLTNFENLFGLNWFQGLLSVLAIIVTVGVYMHEQNKLRKETIIRSCDSILREIQENVESLTAAKYEKITYTASKDINSTEEQVVNYTNVYLDSDAYDSVRFSGSFTHFSSETQHTLTMLYGRIRKRNEMITYAEHLEDTFFMDSRDDEKERKEKWFKTVTKHDMLITRYESEVVRLLNDVKPMIEKEELRQKKRFLKDTKVSKRT